MSGTDEVDALLEEIGADLADGGVYVAPELAAQVSDAELTAIRENLAALRDDADNPVPTYVVLYPIENGDAFNGSPQDLLTRLHQTTGEDGEYYATSRFVQYGDEQGVGLEGRSFDVPGESDGDIYNDELLVLRGEEPATLGGAAERLTALLLEPDDVVAGLAEEARASSYDDESDEDGGVAGPGLVVALVLAAVAGAAAWGVVRRRRAKPDSTAVFALPASAMDRIREAHDRRLEREARDALLALGESVDDTEIGARHDRTSWQAALDHYDAARRALALGADPDVPDVLDVVGALVLARRGQEALSAAVRGRAWTPTETCYLNPLHGQATVTERLASSSAEGGLPERVPVCADCRRDLRAGRVPDVLDVAHRGRARHYFETDVEPWASTGYGSIEPDLVTALQRTRR